MLNKTVNIIAIININIINIMHKPWSQWKWFHALLFNHIVEESMTGKI